MQGTLPERNHLIVGGGIGGLAAAIAFGRNERNATVLERSSFTEESGAGIQLGPNATRILRSLGVLPAIEALAFKPEALAMFDAPSGQRLATVPLGASVETRYGAPYLTLHRADLHSALLASCEQYRSITLTPGFDVQSIDRPDREIVAGSPDGRNIAGDILVGADGLWSVVRKLVAPEAQPRFAHATAYRTMLPRETLPAQFRAPIVGLWLGPKTWSPSSRVATRAKAGTRPLSQRSFYPDSPAGVRIRDHCWKRQRSGGAGHYIDSLRFVVGARTALSYWVTRLTPCCLILRKAQHWPSRTP
jgi:2-polyprenyl-6-methoxyphenol hydroxylase-like FAD-dependent oxidoreductase